MWTRRGTILPHHWNKWKRKSNVTTRRMLSSVHVTKILDLFLMRHAESTNNVLNDILLGKNNLEEELLMRRQADCGLSDRGRSQLDVLEAYLSHGGWNDMLKQRPTTFYSSPMLRCLETADALKRGLHLDQILVKKDLHERGGCYAAQDGVNIGQSGKTSVEIETQFAGFKCLPGMETGWYDKPKKETMDDFHCRVTNVADWLWQQVELTNVDPCSYEEQSGRNQAILVAHGHLITTLINYLIFKVHKSGIFVHHNTGVTHLQMTILNDERVAAVQFCNKTDHLHKNFLEIVKDNPSGEMETMQQLRSGNDLLKDRWAKIFS